MVSFDDDKLLPACLEVCFCEGGGDTERNGPWPCRRKAEIGVDVQFQRFGAGMFGLWQAKTPENAGNQATQSLHVHREVATKRWRSRRGT